MKRKLAYFTKNNIFYGQDFDWFYGIPENVIFEVDEGDKVFRLRAPGYGGDPYGNGRLFVRSKDLKKRHLKWVTK